MHWEMIYKKRKILTVPDTIRIYYPNNNLAS
jgi:hypothetical protein